MLSNVICLICLLLFATGFAEGSQTRLVLLGTGNPQPDPDRSGPASAIVVNGSAYLIDFGPGVVRRAAAARLDKGITELDPANLRVVFTTHLHSDHTAGFPDLILTPWAMGRKQPLEVYGPKGIKAMTDHILAAYSEDINIRSKGMEQEPIEGVRVNVHEIKAGLVYKDANVTVTAFPTKHGEWAESYGYRFDTADRSIVITGDTNPTQATIDACNGCDLLVHEALTEKFLSNPMRPNAQGHDIRAYAAKYHTTTSQLVELANKAKPGILVMYHNPITLRPQKRPLASTPDDLLQEMKGYKGQLTVGRDLDVY
ncbi:MBL fold metallo-hydrolase [Geobacter pelophilus]|uniref:MBL fold metallo-hydrolase n=1 Tax=Geoanaerobacter pelophilus TaxID=60036 RepID=A0AAW4L155_9BACT|nr:MBL fold metallo-hydrolase [Geoanaerobacter pelophilus]MBT0664804.1 MBL fold metallo-hydrolase [Geoanaerobacter pelophilus]